MNKKRKFIYVILLMVIVVTGFKVISYRIKIRNEAIHQHVRELIKNQLEVSDDQIIGSCIYREDKRFVIAVVEPSDYFVIQDDVVKVFDWVNKETKQKYPNVPIDNEFEDLYWVLENCR